jgi:hypothetical protein
MEQETELGGLVEGSIKAVVLDLCAASFLQVGSEALKRRIIISNKICKLNLNKC